MQEFYIPLEYQRNFVWGNKDRCIFIESILMGLPIPFMFFSDTDDGRIEIVDGAQRTQTLVQFCQNDLELQGLEILTDSNGFFLKIWILLYKENFLIQILEWSFWRKEQQKKSGKRFLNALIQEAYKQNQQRRGEDLLKGSLKTSWKNV